MAKTYDDINPHIIIELNGFDFFSHIEVCEDCNYFYKSFGTDTTDWFIDFEDKKYRLNLMKFNSISNQDNHTEEWHS